MSEGTEGMNPNKTNKLCKLLFAVIESIVQLQELMIFEQSM